MWASVLFISLFTTNRRLELEEGTKSSKLYKKQEIWGRWKDLWTDERGQGLWGRGGGTCWVRAPLSGRDSSQTDSRHKSMKI